jgi:hypothetical protein
MKKELNDWSLNSQPCTKRDWNEGKSPVCTDIKMDSDHTAM